MSSTAVVLAGSQTIIVDSTTGTATVTHDGPRGPQGPQGAQGPQGVTGSAGDVGPVGLNGPQGPQGHAGPQGPQGAGGGTGATGFQGPQGADGPQGAQGPQGAAGSSSIAGPQGPQGPQGAAGSNGATGPTGPTGASGSATITVYKTTAQVTSSTGAEVKDVITIPVTNNHWYVVRFMCQWKDSGSNTVLWGVTVTAAAGSSRSVQRIIRNAASGVDAMYKDVGGVNSYAGCTPVIANSFQACLVEVLVKAGATGNLIIQVKNAASGTVTIEAGAIALCYDYGT